MFKFWKTTDEKTGRTVANYQGSFNADLGEYADRAIPKILREEIATKLTDAWIEQYGADLIDQISPEEVTKAIKTLIAQRIVK